jgi:hypothetical protein
MSEAAVYLIRSGAALALFYAFYWLVLRRETFFVLNRAYLLGAAGLSLALPLLRVPSPFLPAVIYTARPAAALVPGSVPASPPGVGPIEVLAAVYLAGAAFFLLLFFVRLGRLALLVRRCGCVRHHGLKVVLCGHAGESFSFFNIVFLNKANVPERDMDRVLAHELAHVRQYHSADIVFTELLTVIQWFNPFVWPYKSSLRETHEYLADRAVIAQGCGLARYQLLIVEQHVGGRLLELASSFRTSQIKRRIDMLSRQQTKGLSRWKPLLILPLAAVLVLAFAEARTVVKADPGAAAMLSGQEKVEKSAPPAKLSEEEMAKALQAKMLQIKDMKLKNEQTLAKLREQLEATSDKAEQEKIQEAMKEQKLMALDIGAKERMLQMKKAELALAKETDPAKKAGLEAKMKELQVEAEDYAKKAETVRSTMSGPKKEKPAEKKIEKK